ncbi:DUF2723 domain-containing protein [Kiritimatiellota bacterium B12222]|nr:DUF2723 domain-containing protein [Kiritimatiellota bacterium B12222]
MNFWSRRDGLTFLLTFVVALGVYTYCLPSSITLEDAGELAVAADYLGVPHPPGYPIWTFLAWFFQWVFNFVSFRGYPNPAWPIAWMSAFFGSLACGGVAVCIRKLCTGLSSPTPTPTPSLQQLIIAECKGGAFALLLFCLIHFSPRWGSLLGGTLSFLFFSLLLLQGVTPQCPRFHWQKSCPQVGDLGHYFMGFLAASLSWIYAWYWLITPQLSFVFPLALCGCVVLFAISFSIRWILQKALQQNALASDITRSGFDLLIATAGGLLLAFSPLMWSQSVIVEVYSLNAFFLSSLLLMVLWYIHSPQDKLLYLTAFLFALGLTNHQSLLFLVFFLISGVAVAQNKHLLKDGLFLAGLGALGFCLLKAQQYHHLNDAQAQKFFVILCGPVLLYLTTIALCGKGIFRSWKQLLCLVGMGVLGLSFHLYMPLASDQNPPMNWGNARTAEGFKHALTRGQYAKFSVAENFKQIFKTITAPQPEVTDDPDAQNIITRAYVSRTLFFRMLGSFFYDTNWKYSMANQFSWELPLEADDPTRAPPAEKVIPLALMGLIPLFCFQLWPRESRGWFISSMVAMFFVTLVFLTIQWPELNHNDLWVKRVQYVQAHVLFAVWMAMGAAIMSLLLYAILPKPQVLTICSVFFCALFIAFPLHKDAKDFRHIEQLGTSNLHNHDYGWQYGFYQLKGAHGILLDELAHHKDPQALLNSWALDYLSDRAFPSDKQEQLIQTAPSHPLPFSEFKQSVFSQLDLSTPEKRVIKEAVTMAAFRMLSAEEQQAQLRYLHRPLPDWDYPPEMDQNAILFGGTDPGRFVPTYMIFSAECREDIYLITQTALADPTYQTTIRDLYGDQIFVPDLVNGNQAFLDYGNSLRLFHPEAFYALMGGGENLSVTGSNEVHEINSILVKQIFEQNQAQHSFYIEEAIQIEWMIFHQRPHGLISKIEPTPRALTQKEIDQDFAFWEWYEEHLFQSWKTLPHERNGFQRDLPVRKSFSKLRMSQAWNYFSRGKFDEAERAMDQAQRFYPANPEAAFRAGDMYMRIGNFKKAEQILNDFTPHDPTNRQLVNFKISLQKLQELEETRSGLHQKLDQELSGNTVVQIMQIAGQFEDQEEVEEMAELLLQLPGLHVDFYIHMAAIMQQLENEEYYQKAVEKWAEVDPTDARAEIDLAVIALSQKRYQDMVGHMVRAVQLDPVKSRNQLAQDPRLVDIRHWPQFQRLVSPTSLK